MTNDKRFEVLPGGRPPIGEHKLDHPANQRKGVSDNLSAGTIIVPELFVKRKLKPETEDPNPAA